MLVSLPEQELCHELRSLSSRYGHHYTEEAHRELIRLLFRFLAGRAEYLPLFFPNGPPSDPNEPWRLRDAQGAIEGAEYTEAARGKPCGHIFKSGEATYRCKTCTADDTCVLCARCFDASDHEGHQVFVHVSPGNSGCCDCGDDEAWVRPVHCTIHTATDGFPGSKSAGKAREGSSLPEDLVESIRMTISRVLDYVIDIFSCSPEQLRMPKTEQTILEDERTSRLSSKWYGYGDEPEENQEFVLILWNDEKHTVNDVRDQVARACKQRKSFGLNKAHVIHDTGRAAIVYSSDIDSLLRMAKIIEEIKLTVTIRSARDTFREQMSDTIVDWISDIAGCSVGNDHQILRRTLCEELLKPWRIGSEASNSDIGRDGLYDHQDEDRQIEETGDVLPLARLLAIQQRLQGQNTDEAEGTNGEGAGPEGNEGESAEEGEDTGDQMDIDELMGDTDADVDMDSYESPDEALEISEATIAGYPPPPPPPARERRRGDVLTPAESDSEPMSVAPSTATVMDTSMQVPQTPRTRTRPLRPPRPPKYWLEKPDGYGRRAGIPPHEDLWVRLRLDHLILYDLRMWKKLRVGVRDVFISTVVTIPEFKRLLGLRFAGVYTVLAQLYLIADREPDHSIINLSLQMLTTPSITAEVVERGNFLTNLIAILYTFLTTRQVGYPWNMDPRATLAFEQGAVTNRRMYHFFLDMKYLLASEHVKERIREEDRYLWQFLDLVKLHQGICPNVRAVGEHIEYETEAWISASLITREINKLCRQFAESFVWTEKEDLTNICRAIRTAAKVAIINSLGAERKRFEQSEIKAETKFKILDAFEFDVKSSSVEGPQYKVIDFVVAKESMSFHHALHYILSWLVDRACALPQEHLQRLLSFSHQELLDQPTPPGAVIPEFSPDEYRLALFDFPLRVCAWLSQMRAGIWVRNGITLRHQMTTYRNVSQRDVSYQRDLFVLQTALVVCDPSVFFASMIDRFGLLGWMAGHYDQLNGFEESQMIDVVEDFVHLLIILLSERSALIPVANSAELNVSMIKRDIAHTLCFKPLSYSDIMSRLSDKVQNMDEFSDVLEEMTKFRFPEGLSDSGTFELKEDYIELVDPYSYHYNRNQREEAETVYRNAMAKKTGKEAADIVFEPKLHPIPSGIFHNLCAFTRKPIFAQVIYYLLGYALVERPGVPATRLEAYLHFALQLLLVAVLEDSSNQHDWSQAAPESFVTSILTRNANFGIANYPTIFSMLKTLAEKEEFKSCEPKIRLIFHRLKQRQQSTFIIASEALHLPVDRMDTASPATVSIEEKEQKKKQALERQARVMASFKEQQGKFMANAMEFDWGEEDFSDMDDDTAGIAMGQEKIEKYPSGTCILCQEETNEQRLYGCFGYVSESNLFRNTPTLDSDWVDEVSQTPVSLDRSADEMRPFGVASKNRRQVEKVLANGERVLQERQELGKGFPYSQVDRGPVSTGCGHIMHYSCFEQYLQATQRRHVSQIARLHPERPKQQEFMCPLCKALGNIFLPIIWKGKKIQYPGVLNADDTFDEWIGSQVAINIQKLDKSPERTVGDPPANLNRQQKSLYDYGIRDFIAPVANHLPDVLKSVFVASVVPPPQAPAHHQFQVPAFVPGQNEDPREPTVVPIDASAGPTPQNYPMVELVRVYLRLRDTFQKNIKTSLYPYHTLPSMATEDLTQTDTLGKTLGYSIAAVEIAQRGVSPDSVRGTLIDKISPQALTHLRVYSETATSYIAIGSLRNQASSKTMDEYLNSQYRQLHQLFVGHPGLFDSGSLLFDLKGISPLLAMDPFVFLSECAICMVPALNLDIHHVVRLCYIAEIVRVVMAYATNEEEFINENGPFQHPDRFINGSKISEGAFTAQQRDNLFNFICRIATIAKHNDVPASANLDDLQLPDQLSNSNFGYFIYTMAVTYALPFVRKVAILMHVRYGVEFPSLPFERADEPELGRLSSLLKLPSLHEIFASFSADSQAGHTTRSVVAGWVRHFNWTREGKRPQKTYIPLSHPAILELIGLPKNYDTLTDEAIRRKCPTTGRELTDPAICLFCGEIMCSQAVCCTKNKAQGGCVQHTEKCGGNIGIFINIRKCMVLFLNKVSGTWAVAPYLDKHGEVDPTLRRHHQLFLNQKRYDVLLRKVWLEGGIQSLIARRLEGDINNGGWETL